jgi:hypothetical protein
MRNAPYEHSLLIDIIKTKFFSHSESVGVRSRSSFITSLPDKAPMYQEPEVPIPMVALASTAVSLHYSLKSPANNFNKTFACIDEFLTHSRSKSDEAVSDFSTSIFLDCYRRHIGYLDNYKSKHPIPFHVTMGKLYAKARYVTYFAPFSRL